jgi:hypothetical protein
MTRHTADIDLIRSLPTSSYKNFRGNYLEGAIPSL